MPGSELGMQQLLRRNAEAMYAKASAMHIRTGSLDQAVENMKRAEDAISKGAPIQQVREYQRRAIEALKKTQAELGSGVVTDTIGSDSASSRAVEQTAGVPDEAPAGYRDLVADYFKSLGAQ